MPVTLNTRNDRNNNADITKHNVCKRDLLHLINAKVYVKPSEMDGQIRKILYHYR